jgi:uncharacterized protein (DUF58 family)
VNAVDRLLDGELRRQLESLELPVTTAASGLVISRHVARQRGASLHYRQSRPYAAGDDPRLLDWNLLARTGKPFVREFEQETDRQTLVVVDASGSMNYGDGPANKLLWAIKMAAALIYVLGSHHEPAGWAVVGGDRGVVRPGVWPAARPAQLSRSTAVGPTGTRRPLAVLADLAAHADGLIGFGRGAGGLMGVELPKRHSCVVLISDMLWPAAELEAWLGRLTAGRSGLSGAKWHKASLIRVNHRDERDWPFQSWAELEGLEGEGMLAVEGPAVRRMYLANLTRHEEAIAAAARRHRASLQWNTTDQSVISAVREWVNSQNGVVAPPPRPVDRDDRAARPGRDGRP